MSNELPDFEKAEYLQPPTPPVLEGEVFKGGAWSTPRASASDFPKAILFGLVAAAIGSVVYAAFTLITHIEFGLVAIFLGIFIAGAMMHASNGIGGRKYQIAAALLTYLSVACAITFEILYHLQNRGIDISHLTLPSYLKLGLIGITSPFTELKGNFISGALSLAILFFGIQSAWRTAAGKRVA